tara:strand:- start:9714 stop:10808 length:1095 start_codon:yes stop_codon:yes gene_type:complete
MGIFAPELNTAGSSVQAVAPPVNLTEDQLTNIGKGIADIIGGIIPPKPAEGLVSDQETEEDYVIPEGTPQTTPASSTSGLPIEAQAFLDAIASAEGTGGDYNIIVGGSKFDSFEQHPGIVGLKTKAGPSTAAGKYQITKQTWDDLQKKYPDLTDFSPDNQDKAAFYLATDRYKRGTKGRDLAADLAAGNTSYLRESLQSTWTGIRVTKDFEKTIDNNTKSRSTTVLKPVGFTNMKYSNEQAIRNKTVAPELELKLDVAVSTILGTGYTVEIFSGGQEKKGKGVRRTGSIRHDVDDLGRGLAADVRIYDPAGKQITDRTQLDKVRDFWIQKNYGSVGTYMPGAGIHFDIWTKDKLLPGMSSTWSY